MKIYNKITDLIGNTPMFELTKIKNIENIDVNLYAKLENFNPAGSAKDRVAKAMIEDAERQGLINKDTVIIEGTSGNTGIGLAMVGASKGYKVIIVMPNIFSQERIKFMQAYGAEVVLTDGEKGMFGVFDKVKELQNKYKNSFVPDQFSNMSNPNAHKMTTGVEIYNDLDGKIDMVVGGVGTGGTISGIGECLKEKNKKIKVIAVEPFESPMLTKGIVGHHGIQGMGASMMYKTINMNIFDEVMTVKSQDAIEYSKIVAKTEGIFVGISSGAVLKASIDLAKRLENKNKNIVMVFPDSGDRYLSV